MCHVVWRFEMAVNNWQIGVTMPVRKTGDRNVCTNYQGIALLILPEKVYSQMS